MTRRLLCALAAPLVLGGCMTEFDRGLLDAARSDGGGIDGGGIDSGGIDGGAIDGGVDGGVVGPCPDVRLVEGTDAVVEPTVGAVPPQGETFRDPTYGTCVTRISDYAIEGFETIDPPYRGTLDSVGSEAIPIGGAYRNQLYELDTRAYGGELFITAQERAHYTSTTPGRFYRLTGPFTITEETADGTIVDTHDLTAAIMARFADATAIDLHPRGVAADDSVLALGVDTTVGRWRGVALVELATDTVISSRALTDSINPDARTVRVGVSPSGDFVVVAIAFEETGPLDLLDVHPRDLSASVFSLTAADNVGAFDVARNAGGGDALVYTVGRRLMRLDLVTPIGAPVQVTDRIAAPMTDPDRRRSNVVISGAAFDQPGWIVLSFATCTLSDGATCEPGALWAQDKIVLVSIDDTPRFLNLTWHRSTVGGSRHPYALPSRDLSRIVFQSTWGQPGPNGADLYLIELPPGAVGAP